MKRLTDQSNSLWCLDLRTNQTGMMLWAGAATAAAAAGAFPTVAYSPALKVSKSPKDGEAAILALAFTQPPVFPT